MKKIQKSKFFKKLSKLKKPNQYKNNIDMLYIFKNTSFIKTGVVESKKDLDIAVRISKKPIKKTNIII